MNRRSFLKRLGLGGAALVAAPVLGANYSQLVPAEPKVVVPGWRAEPFAVEFLRPRRTHTVSNHLSSLSMVQSFGPAPDLLTGDPLAIPDPVLEFETTDGRRYTDMRVKVVNFDHERRQMEIEFEADKLGRGVVRGISYDWFEENAEVVQS